MIMCVQNKLDQEARRAMKNTSIVSDIRLFERSDFKGSRAAQSRQDWRQRRIQRRIQLSQSNRSIVRHFNTVRK